MDDISKYGFPSHCCDYYEPGAPLGPWRHSTESQEQRNMAFETQEGGEPN